MLPLIRRLATTALLACAIAPFHLAHGEPPATFTEVIATREHVVQLRHGGYVLYMRHGATDTRQPDHLPRVDLNDCSTQRPLTDEGRTTSIAVGRALREAHIPIGEILVSPYCRTKESALLAFGKNYTVVEQLMYSANMTAAEKAPNLLATRRILAAPVPPGSNRVIVAHAPNLADLIDYFIAPEGTIAIFRPKADGGDPEYVASIPPTRWRDVLKD